MGETRPPEGRSWTRLGQSVPTATKVEPILAKFGPISANRDFGPLAAQAAPPPTSPLDQEPKIWERLGGQLWTKSYAASGDVREIAEFEGPESGSGTTLEHQTRRKIRATLAAVRAEVGQIRPESAQVLLNSKQVRHIPHRCWPILILDEVRPS